MTPTGSKAFSCADLITRLYEDDAAAILGIPRNNPYFFSIALNKDASEIIPPNTTAYIPHNNGEKVLECNHKFHFAPLTYVPCIDLCNGNRVDTIDNDIPNFSSRNVQQAKDGLVQLGKSVSAFNTTWSTGLFAIPKLNPALQSTDFQNSCIYYDVQFALNVSMDYNSLYASGPIHDTPDKLIAIPTKANKNKGGQTLCGYFDEGIL
ncbi:hypothetical protein FQA39_LY09821 [Lamprigera yunnana]|nr:hypothetical protein FQA39_LY09821 [Lamprigera yunnana]